VSNLGGAIKRKARTFREIWRSDGPGVAFKVALFSARNSLVYWTARLLEALHVRPLGRHDEWRSIDPSSTRISVVTPVHNTPPEVLRKCIESVRAQEHTAWELCMCDDCSTRADTIEVLTAYRGSDPRIRIVRSDEPLGISGATNLAAEQATGEFIALLDHDDELHPQALSEIADAARRHDALDLLYTDEDKIEPEGAHGEPYHKPDWSPDHLNSVMYVLHCLTIRKALFWRLEGLRSRFDGAQDYDLALRASRLARYVHHVPRILYHWRKIPGSAAAVVDAKPKALLAAREALQEHAANLDARAVVEEGFFPGTFRLRRALDPPPPVTLVVLTADPVRSLPGRGEVRLLPNLLRGFAHRTTYPGLRVLVVHDGPLCSASAQAVAAVSGRAVAFHDPLAAEEGFSFARKANFAVGLVETEHLILLNDDLEILTPGWIEALLEPLMDPQVAVCGARLLYPDGRVQHAGIVIGVNGGAAHVFHGMPGDFVGHGTATHIIRNYAAVTAAVFATKRSTFAEIGGFDEAFAHDYQDVDFCLRALRSGYRVVYTPFAELVHHEGATLQRTAQDPVEVALFRERWPDFMERDPYYNPNLPRDRLDCEP
jgi:GT2 family glycosyltransferase